MTQEKKQSTALTISVDSHGAMVPSNVAEAIEMAKMFAASDMVPKQFIGKPGNVLIAIQMGASLGLAPFPSLANIAVINGRPSLWGDAMLGLILARADCQSVEEWKSDDGQTAFCEVRRRGRPPVERSFSMTQAKKAGLAVKTGPWQQYPDRMLQLRARGFALRDSYADVLTGVSMAEEARDYEPEHVVDQSPEYIPEGRHDARPRRVSQNRPPEPDLDTQNSPQDAPGSSQDDQPDPEPAPPPETAQNATGEESSEATAADLADRLIAEARASTSAQERIRILGLTEQLPEKEKESVRIVLAECQKAADLAASAGQNASRETRPKKKTSETRA